jgi:type II secretory pathway pseudopilin PulG
VVGQRAGFTLAEALVALTISSLVVVLVATVFLVQNRYYAVQTERSAAQDVARAVTQVVGAEVRPATRGSVVTARSDSLTLRTPMALVAVCAVDGTGVHVQLDGGEAGLVVGEVSGVASFDPGTDRWGHHAAPWSALDGGATGAAAACAANGADTVGARHAFHTLRGLGGVLGALPDPGTVLALYRETTFVFRGSELEPGRRAFFRGTRGAPLLEYATGLDSTAGFRYRLAGSSTYRSDVADSRVADVDAVRVVADARRPVRAGGAEDVTFGWSANVPLGNAP